MTSNTDLSLFGTRRAIDYLLGMTQPQRQTKIISGIARLLEPHYAIIQGGGGAGHLSTAEQASIRAGLAAAHDDAAHAARNRAHDVFCSLAKTGGSEGSNFHTDYNQALLPTPGFAIFLHEGRKITQV